MDRAVTMRIRVKASMNFHVGRKRGGWWYCSQVDSTYWLFQKPIPVADYYNGPIELAFILNMQIGDADGQSH